MAVVNHTGAIAADEVWDHIVDEHHFTGATTLNNGTDITNVTGAGQNPLRWDGNYSFVSAGTTGTFMLTATSSNRFQFQPNGLTTAWNAFQSYSIYWGPSTGSGVWAVQYVDAYYAAFLNQGSGNNSLQDVTMFYGSMYGGFYLGQTAGTPTFNDLSAYYVSTQTYGSFCLNSAGAETLTNLKAYRCGTMFVFGGNGVRTITNAYAYECIAGTSAATPASTTSLIRFVFYGPNSSSYIWYSNLAAPSTYTLDEWYTYGGGANAIYNAGNAVPAITNSVVRGGPNTAGVVLRNMGSSGNDVLSEFGTNAPIYDGTSNGDCIHGYRNAFYGTTSADWVDYAVFAYFVDPIDEVTSSTSNPKGFDVLDSNRSNAILSPLRPTTWSGVSSSVAGGNVTVTGTSGIKCASQVEFALSSGGTIVLRTPWQYDGFLDPLKRADFTLPVTSHSHVVSESNLAAGVTLWCRLKGRDPLGRPFYSSWGSFTTTAADFPAVGNVRDTDTVNGAAGTLSSNKILKSNATGDGAGNYNDDNLAIGNVRPIAFGIGLTGDLSNLVATDAAYVSLENSRNNDNGTVAADILTGKSVKIRNVTTDGTLTAAGGGKYDKFAKYGHRRIGG